MAKYVDGFVIVMPEKNVHEYKKMAKLGAKVWKKYGALDYKECVSEDIYSKSMGMAPVFPKMTNLKKGEVVVFSYIVFKSRKHRDQVNKKVMQDPLMSPEAWKDKPVPFDMERVAYGGFEVLVEI
jgi:uncharacterized protein YbaA (DUF1428 family)